MEEDLIKVAVDRRMILKLISNKLSTDFPLGERKIRRRFSFSF